MKNFIFNKISLFLLTLFLFGLIGYIYIYQPVESTAFSVILIVCILLIYVNTELIFESKVASRKINTAWPKFLMFTYRVVVILILGYLL